MEWRSPPSDWRNCKIIERDWLGYVVDVATMGAYTTYRVHKYSECIRQSYPVISLTGSYKRYKQEVSPLLNKIEVDDKRANTDQSTDTTR
jgi:hypothetical protein